SSTIENLDDDDDEDVYDPNKPTLFQKIQPQITNTTEQTSSKKSIDIPANTNTTEKIQGNDGQSLFLVCDYLQKFQQRRIHRKPNKRYSVKTRNSIARASQE
ncbi:unnamed protein product, partial [Rotaria socialis]